MKKVIGFGSALLLSVVAFVPAQAAPVHFEKTFKNCTELNKVYKGGVAKKSGIVNQGGKTKYAPKVSAKIYAENKTKDRDGDGIACEK
jgi:hypothetical protein